MEIRKVYAPYSKTGEQVGQTPVKGYIEVNQAIYPVLQTGSINEDGEWVGLKSSDKDFIAYAKDEAIPNTGEILAPQASGDIWPLDMTGFNDLQIAIRPTNAGNYAITAVMAPATFPYANLRDVDAAATLRGCTDQSYPAGASSFDVLFDETSEPLTADVWNIFLINGRLSNQKLMQFKITNNSGGESNIQFAYLRMV